MSSELEDALYALDVVYHDVSDSKETKAYYEGLKSSLRQLAEQRAELLEALRSTRGVLVCALKAAAPDFFTSDEDVSDHIQIQIIDEAIANATQQRNATGGEG